MLGDGLKMRRSEANRREGERGRKPNRLVGGGESDKETAIARPKAKPGPLP